MKLLYYFSFCVLLSLSANAQQIQVVNKLTNEPIPGVAVYNSNKSKSTISNFEGFVDIDTFLSGELLYFQHLSYVSKSVKKAVISNIYVLYLIPNTHGLDEITISASKFGQKKKDIPQKIVSVSADIIEMANPQTSADLLASTGQVYIQKSQLGGGSPMIRGFSTNRLLITVDGVRMNNAIFRGGNIQNVISIDPLSIENTEVTLGAGSVIYGSDAIGGVMSFYTHRPKVTSSDSLQFSGSALTRYSSANSEKTGHLALNIGLKKWAFLTNVSYASFDNLKMGTHGPSDYLRSEYITTTDGIDVVTTNSNPLIQKFSEYNQLNLLQKIHFEQSNNLSFDLGLFYTTTSDIPRYDRLIRYNENQLLSAEWYYGPQSWFMANLNMTKLSSRSNLYDKIKVTTAYQNFQESRVNRDFESAYRNIREEKVHAFTFNLDLEKKLSEKTQLFYGFEYVYNKIRSKGEIAHIYNNTINATVSRYPDGANWQSAAAYSSIKFKPNPKFVFQSGLRFNHVSYNASFKENNQYLNLPFESSKSSAGALTGTAGISWSPSQLIQWRFNLSSAFRAPNIDDVGKVFDSEPGSVVVPNQNLKPEYAYGGELGFKSNFNGKVIFECATYYTYLDNALVRRDYNLNGETEIFYDGELSTIQAMQNASKAWIYGFETSLKVQINEHLNSVFQYNVIGGTEDDNGTEVPIRHVAPNFGNTHLVWTNSKFKIDAFVNFNEEMSFNELAPSEAEKDYLYAKDGNGNPYAPSWYTLNLRTQYNFSEKFSLNFGLENITDQRYRSYSSGISDPGRNFITSIKYSF